MKIIKSLRLLTVLCIITNPIIAFTQISAYQFLQSSRNFNVLNDGSLIGNTTNIVPSPGWVTQPSLFNGSTSSTESAVTGEGFPIGFDFVFNGQVFDRFAVSTNGYIRLGRSNAGFEIKQYHNVGDIFNNSSDNSATNIIAPFQGNLNLTGYYNAVGYVTRGLPGKRALCISWSYQNNARYPDNIFYYLLLYENSNIIEFMYGNYVYKGNPLQVAIGFKGSETNNELTNIKLRKITIGENTWATSGEGTSNTDYCDFSATFRPATDAFLVFAWTPPTTMPIPYKCPVYYFVKYPYASYNPPAGYEIVTPADQVNNVALNPTLNWSGFFNTPTQYDVYFGTDNPPIALVSADKMVTQFKTPILAPETDYYYKIVSKNADTVLNNCTGTFRTGQTLNTCPPTVLGGLTMIKALKLNTISFTRTSANESIFDFPAEGIYTTSLSRNGTYTFSFTFNGSTSGYSFGVYTFLDLNQDGDFDDTGERYDIGVITQANQTITKPVTIPATTRLGVTKMRIRVIQTLETVNPTACDIYDGGQAAQEYTVTILPAPGCENLTVTSTKTDVDCFGNNTGAINLTVSGGVAPYTFTWAGETIAAEDRIGLSSGTYQATATDANGCTVTTPRIAIIQPGAVTRPLITANGPVTFCDGGHVILSGPSGFPTYVWSSGAALQHITAQQAGSYTLKVKNANGCESPLSDPVTITTLEAPDKPFITVNSAMTFCSGNSTELSAPPGYTGYHWSSGETTQNITVTKSGAFTVQVKNSNCSSQDSESTAITVFPLPATPDKIRLISTDSLEAIDTFHTSAYYEWRVNNTVLKENTARIKAVEAGTYSVRGISSEGCFSAGSISYSFIVTGIENIAEDDLTIYPNPNDGEFYIKTGRAITGSAEVSVLNAIGQILLIQHTNFQEEQKINMNNYSPGLYYIMIRKNDRVLIKKVVIR